MKLATLKNGRRDGQLVVVSKDLHWYSDVGHIAPTLQAALDDWETLEPRLTEVATGLEIGLQPKQRFHEHDAHSPLPRAYQWADGSAYLNHVELVRKARGAELAPGHLTDPLIYQGGSDTFCGPREAIKLKDEAFDADFEAEIAVITGDVPQGWSMMSHYAV